MSTFAAPLTKHVWNFIRTGGLDQVALETAEDLLALDELDQKLWIVLSCPVKGLELDEQTLALIDTDRDGHIHVREVIAAVKWAAAHLKRPADLLAPAPALPLDAINDLAPDGKILLASARHILASLGKPDAAAISVADGADTARILAGKAPNGDGVVTLRATSDPATQALIKQIIATVGGVRDRAGDEGITTEKIDAFFGEAQAYLDWVDATAEKQVPELGESTAAAFVALRAVRGKVDDFFARCRLAAFDARALGALNRQETEYLTVAAKDLSIETAEIAGFPLARVDADAPLPLLERVNPAWAPAIATLHRLVVAPLFGPEKSVLAEDDWRAIATKFAPFEAWLGTRTPSALEKLGASAVRELVNGPARRQLAELVAADMALASEYNAISSVERLARYHRDLGTLLRNFVNLVDFYAPDRLAVFQAGTLYLDARACTLCVHVDDMTRHAAVAGRSMAYVAYLDCRRPGGEKMTIAACFTQGDSDYLFVGRNGLFYDRKGRDWDASIVKVVEAPISVRQAFWTPYRKVASFVEDQFAKFASAREQETTAKLSSGVSHSVAVPPGTTAKPAAQAFDIARFAGIFAAIGLAIGAIGGAIASVFTGFLRLEPWQMPLAVAAALLVISGPSMLLAALKLRQRNLAPLLEPNGWAINRRVKINIPFGATLTARATLPPDARRAWRDPYADVAAARRRTIFWSLLVLLCAGLLVARVLRTWPFEEPQPAAEATPAERV